MKIQEITWAILLVVIGSLLFFGFHLSKPLGKSNTNLISSTDEMAENYVNRDTLAALLSDIKSMREASSLAEKSREENYTKIVKTIDRIEQRLSTMELAQDHLIEAQLAFSMNASDEQELNETGFEENNAFEKINEQDIQNWLDDSISSNNYDPHTTQAVLSELSSTMARLPGVSIESLHCSDGFCRTGLLQENGKTPDISGIVGLPPITGSGFSVPGEEGRAMFYFAQGGTSMEDISEHLADKTP